MSACLHDDGSSGRLGGDGLSEGCMGKQAGALPLLKGADQRTQRAKHSREQLALLPVPTITWYPLHKQTVPCD